MKLLPFPAVVEFESVVLAIERFNQAGLNPYGPNIPVITHRPLTLRFEGPEVDIELEFHLADRAPETRAFLSETPAFETRHSVLYPMTRAMIQRQWHRVYAFDVAGGHVADVKLLVGRKQDPALFVKHPDVSAWPWINDLKQAPEPMVSALRRPDGSLVTSR